MFRAIYTIKINEHKHSAFHAPFPPPSAYVFLFFRKSEKAYCLMVKFWVLEVFFSKSKKYEIGLLFA